MKRFLDWHGISDAEAFFRECVIALGKATTEGKKIQWPLRRPITTTAHPQIYFISLLSQIEFRGQF